MNGAAQRSEIRTRLHEGSRLAGHLVPIRTQPEAARLMGMKVATFARTEYLALWKIARRLREKVTTP